MKLILAILLAANCAVAETSSPTMTVYSVGDIVTSNGTQYVTSLIPNTLTESEQNHFYSAFTNMLYRDELQDLTRKYNRLKRERIVLNIGLLVVSFALIISSELNRRRHE